MKDLAELCKTLSGLEGRSYRELKKLKGRYQCGDFELSIDHVQGDPFAAPSKFRCFLPQAKAQLPLEFFKTRSRAVGLRDYLTRSFAEEAAKVSSVRGSGKSGLIAIDVPGQQVLERTSCFVSEDQIEMRFVCGLPADGRRIRGKLAAQMVGEELPKIVRSALFLTSLDSAAIEAFVTTVEDADALRDQLRAQGLAAFVANGSRLARRSGVDDRPLVAGSLPFESPQSLQKTLITPNRGAIVGMGVPHGVTLIVGGGYHGKSTLLRAMEFGVYNHIPGDGREFVVADHDAVKVRSEDGRSVSGVDISPFINNLPFERSTSDFSTTNASGSTSQAASTVEAIEVGCKVLLVDEDTSATNFMIRDRRMQELIVKDKEPITPFADKVRQLYSDHGVSTILVMGGSGDYFDHADTVISMEAYSPSDATKRAKAIAKDYKTGRLAEGGAAFGAVQKRAPKPSSFDARRGRREVNLKVRRVDEITYGSDEIDLSAVEQLVHESQIRAIAQAIYVLANGPIDGTTSLASLCADLETRMQAQGLESLSEFPDGDLARFRRHEFVAAVNRLRTLEIGQI